MAEHPLPMIRDAEDYKAIRHLPESDLPESFNVWTYERGQEALQIVRGGHVVVHVEIKPHEFASYCRSGRQHANLHAIKAFAIEAFRRQRDKEARIIESDRT